MNWVIVRRMVLGVTALPFLFLTFMLLMALLTGTSELYSGPGKAAAVQSYLQLSAWVLPSITAVGMGLGLLLGKWTPATPWRAIFVAAGYSVAIALLATLSMSPHVLNVRLAFEDSFLLTPLLVGVSMVVIALHPGDRQKRLSPR